jgi:glycine cleavage system aminomethyltransferase T
MSHEAERRDFEGEARAAQAKAAQALGRLLHLAQTLDSGQVRRVARFIDALYDGEVSRSTSSSFGPSTRGSATTCWPASTHFAGAAPTSSYSSWSPTAGSASRP